MNNLDEAIEKVSEWLDEPGNPIAGGWLDGALNLVLEAAWRYSELDR